MAVSQQDLRRLASTPSCYPRVAKSRSSNTYISYTDMDLGSKFHAGGSSKGEPCCDHWQFCEKVPNRSEVEADSLGSPVGLVCSNATLNNPCGSSPMQQEANVLNFATYLKAFALIYVLPEVDWTAEKIDMLLEEGTDLFRASSEVDRGEDDRDENKLLEPEIYTNEEKRIRRNFNLEGHTFTLALEPRYLGAGSKPLEQQPSHTINNLGPVLLNFFKSSRYCLLLTRVGHLLVWRRRKVFFVLDVKGRRKEDLETVQANGVAMLVCLKTIDNVVHLASNLSGISPQDEFTIRELVVVRLETPDGRIYMRDTSHRSIEFKVVNKSYAYLKATLHLSLNENDPVRNRSSLMVAVGSILASKIDHPANWDTNMLDRLICYGVELCRNCWSDCLRDRRPIDLDTFPTQLRMGQYVLELKLIPNVRTGHWKCGVRIIGTDFEAHVSEALGEFGNVVFQIGNQMYAIWVKDGFYYLLDPYRHTIVGTHVAEDQAKGAKWATVRMFRDQLTMLSVFHQLLKESNRQTAYYLHVVRIRNLAECPDGYFLAPLPEGVDNQDVKSLNEPILFNEQQGVSICDKSLGEISDFEDDVVSRTGDKFDIEKFRFLDERQNAGAEGEMCEEEVELHAESQMGIKNRNRECRIKPCKNTSRRASARTKMSLLKKEQENQRKLEQKTSRKIQDAKNEAVKGKFPSFNRPTGGRSSSQSSAKSPLLSTSKEVPLRGRIMKQNVKSSRQTAGMGPSYPSPKFPEHAKTRGGSSPGGIMRKNLKSSRQTGPRSSIPSPHKIPEISTSPGKIIKFPREIGVNYSPSKCPLPLRSGDGSSPVRMMNKMPRQTGGMSFGDSPAKSHERSRSKDASNSGRTLRKVTRTSRKTGGMSSSPSPAMGPVRSRSREGSSPVRIMKKNLKSPREIAGRSSNHSPLPARTKSPVRSKSTHGSPHGKMAFRRSSKGNTSKGMACKVANAKGTIISHTAAKLLIPHDAISKSSNQKPVVTKVTNTKGNTNGWTPNKGTLPQREPPRGGSTLKESAKIILAQTGVLQQSVDKSNGLGVAPVQHAHLNTPAVSDFVRQLDQVESTPLPTGPLNIGESNELPEENPTEGNESLFRFPGFNRVPQLLAVAGSESGTVESLNRVLGSAFKVANRVLTMTPWGNYVVFRHHPTHRSDSAATWFYLFDGCTCDIDRFRHLDLSTGTAGLIAFRKQSEVVCHIIDSREEKALNMLRTQMEDPPSKRMQKLLVR
ncbi:uncharacterized protein ms(3)76Cc [Drosophila takahashii]|uniref:uncharacterized protein ms(3)76Cc n=1 Tax=Drosophila takahashii TaxID=29030 RepID=UPI001CF8C2C2|nr:uncharacterized protein LOC108058093 [Drosophila takahashii]